MHNNFIHLFTQYILIEHVYLPAQTNNNTKERKKDTKCPSFLSLNSKIPIGKEVTHGDCLPCLNVKESHFG